MTAPVVRRPRAHFTAPRNWMNDPNGLIHHDGRYHVFYQFNPSAPIWGPPLWGHASSTDLAFWADHEPALVPRPDGPDRDGCWSGCCRIVAGRPTIFYTAVVEAEGRRTESVCTADGSLDLVHWAQARVPVIPGPPAGLDSGYHRDPFVFGEAGAWRMLIGSGFLGPDHDSGAILHYGSSDLATWKYRGVLLERRSGQGPVDTGPLWECPQVFSDGGIDVLVFSVNTEDGGPDHLRYPVYCTGRLTEEGFELRAISRLDHGNVFYAPAILRDQDDRLLLWGWVQEKHGRLDVDHSGALSLPRVVTLDGDRLRMEPAPELARLRRTSVSFGTLVPGALVDLPTEAVHAGSFELEATVRNGSVLTVELSADDGFPYRLTVDARAGSVTVASGGSGPFVAPLKPDCIGHAIRLFVDGSLVELFVGDDVVITTRYYEPPPTRLTIVNDGIGALDSAAIHGLAPAVAESRNG